MNKITFVTTHHSEFGKCNSDELYKIIKLVRPDVIFEELNQDLFDKFYNRDEVPFETPEINAVKRYINEYTAIHIPVDINLSDTLSVDEINYMFSVFKKYRPYSLLYEEQRRLAFENGYSFLNSKENEILTEKMKSLENGLIEFQVNKNQLLRIHKLFYDEQHFREHEVIKNIYNYSEKAPYNQALLLFGSGHRKTIFEKVKKIELEDGINLNWTLYGN